MQYRFAVKYETHSNVKIKELPNVFQIEAMGSASGTPSKRIVIVESRITQVSNKWSSHAVRRMQPISIGPNLLKLLIFNWY